MGQQEPVGQTPEQALAWLERGRGLQAEFDAAGLGQPLTFKYAGHSVQTATVTAVLDAALLVNNAPYWKGEAQRSFETAVAQLEKEMES